MIDYRSFERPRSAAGTIYMQYSSLCGPARWILMLGWQSSQRNYSQCSLVAHRIYRNFFAKVRLLKCCCLETSLASGKHKCYSIYIFDFVNTMESDSFVNSSGQSTSTLQLRDEPSLQRLIAGFESTRVLVELCAHLAKGTRSEGGMACTEHRPLP